MPKEFFGIQNCAGGQDSVKELQSRKRDAAKV